MKRQFNTNANNHGTKVHETQVSATAEQALGRFEEHITRSEAYLTEENAGKRWQHDDVLAGRTGTQVSLASGGL